MFPSKFLQFPSILTHFHAANEKIQNGGRDLAISRGLVWVNKTLRNKLQWILSRNYNIFIQENAFKVSSANRRPFCLDLNELNKCGLVEIMRSLHSMVMSLLFSKFLNLHNIKLNIDYRQFSNIRRTQSQNINVSRLVLQLSLSNPLMVLSWEWRCSWSSADRRCSNYIWVINNFIAY